VKVGGVDVRRYNLESLREEVAMVLQKNILFSGTIAENLRWGAEHASDEELVQACRIAQADSFISGLGVVRVGEIEVLRLAEVRE